MIIVTTNKVKGKRIEKTLGLVYGAVVRGVHLGDDIIAGMKNKFGGEIEEYTKLLASAREQSLDRMKAQAEALGADGIVTFRFATCEIANHAAEMIAYGTAVTFEKAH